MLVAGHQRVNFHGPCLNTTDEISHVQEALTEQNLLGMGGAHAVVAHTDNLLVAPTIEFSDAHGQSIQGNMAGPIDVGNRWQLVYHERCPPEKCGVLPPAPAGTPSGRAKVFFRKPVFWRGAPYGTPPAHKGDSGQWRHVRGTFWHRFEHGILPVRR